MGISTIKSTNEFFSVSNLPRGLDMSLRTYMDSSVYYRAGDNSANNLEPKFVALSKTNRAIVKEAPSTNNIIHGKYNIVQLFICSSIIPVNIQIFLI